MNDPQVSAPVRIPADVELEDRLLAGLTGRQLSILAVTGVILYGGWTVARGLVPLPVFAVVAIPVGAAAVIVALGSRDGVTLDRLLLAALRQHRTPRHQVAAPEGVRPAPDWLAAHVASAPGRRDPAGGVSPAALRLPAQGVTDAGALDLGDDGVAIVAVASTVNFALRTATEQQSLVACFGRYLHSLTAPIQVLVRAERLDLSAQIADLQERAPALPHPALEAAALEHADYLTQLGDQADLLRRQVLLVLREPLLTTHSTAGLDAAGPRRRVGRGRDVGRHHNEAARQAAERRLVRRLSEAIELLSPAGIMVSTLDAGQATAVLAAACDPDNLIPPTAGLAGTDDIITTPPDDDPGPSQVAGLDDHDDEPAAGAHPGGQGWMA